MISGMNNLRSGDNMTDNMIVLFTPAPKGASGAYYLDRDNADGSPCSGMILSREQAESLYLQMREVLGKDEDSNNQTENDRTSSSPRQIADPKVKP